MSMEIIRLDENHEEAYSHFLLQQPDSWIYTSLRYRDFLRRVANPQSLDYWLVYDNDRLTGCLPAMLSQPGTYGPIINSLPFFGSNGGLLYTGPTARRSVVEQSLQEVLATWSHSHQAATATIIPHPIRDTDVPGFWRAPRVHDERIAQFTPLPPSSPRREERLTSLLNLVHQKTRNCIRKSWKSSLHIRHSSSTESMKALFSLHRECMEAIGGQWKPWPVFQALQETFVYEDDYRVYLSEKDGTVIAGLLILFYNQTAEYFIPASKAGYRTEQPMSGLIAEAMQHAMERGMRYWNWGATWPSQHGVYQFKKRWGTREIPYRYSTWILNEAIRASTAETLRNDYPNWYAIPFRELATN